MARYYLDTSAIAKRYVFEPGQQWIQDLCVLPGQRELYICDLTLVEVVNVFCHKAEQRKQGKPPRQHGAIERDLDDLIALFLGHCDLTTGEYLIRSVTAPTYFEAIQVRRSNTLDSGDALQLACLLALRDEAISVGRAAPEFICADTRLRKAAEKHGVQVHNPEDFATAAERANTP